MQVPTWAPDRIYVQPDNGGDSPCYWSDERVTPQDVLYVRRDLAGADTPEIAQHGTQDCVGPREGSGTPDRAAMGRTGHWTGTEEAQANYLIAAMTGHTPEEVKEPLSRLLDELRYGSRAPSPLNPGGGAAVFCVDCGAEPMEGEQFYPRPNGWLCAECK